MTMMARKEAQLMKSNTPPRFMNQELVRCFPDRTENILKYLESLRKPRCEGYNTEQLCKIIREARSSGKETTLQKAALNLDKPQSRPRKITEKEEEENTQPPRNYGNEIERDA
ncbi:hypothetical protein PUN28_017868 [Cardiocondyla obscurior]|uniref:Uncharacterized protein n=1 Tax=Cardiocondyla obscurior TaxID=286306 RepID=A0AAW2ENM6_9HYME